jgi:hypothetical protein
MADKDEVLLTIRLPRSLRDAFRDVLEQEDQKASQVLRAAIRGYIREHGASIPAPAPRPAQASEPLPPPTQSATPTPPGPAKASLSGFKSMCGIDDED